jgi:hypothetical protein
MQIEVYKRILGMEAVQNMINKDDRCECGTGKKYNDLYYPVFSADLLTAGSAGGKSAVIHSLREIFSSTCPR